MYANGFLQRYHPAGVGVAFFIRTKAARAKAGKGKTCGERPKRTESFIFFQKKQIKHAFQPTFSKVDHAVKKNRNPVKSS